MPVAVGPGGLRKDVSCNRVNDGEIITLLVPGSC